MQWRVGPVNRHLSCDCCRGSGDDTYKVIGDMLMMAIKNEVVSRRTGVTLLELLLAAVFIGTGVVVAMRAGSTLGVSGYVGGFFVGALGAFAVVAAFGCGVTFTIGLLTGIPEYPVCSNGKCRDRKPPMSTGTSTELPRSITFCSAASRSLRVLER